VQLLLVEFDDARLPLALPIREQADEHLVLDYPVGFIDIVRTGVGEIAEAGGNVLLGFALIHVAALEVWAVGRAELGRHIAVRRVEDEPLGFIAQGSINCASLNVGLDGRDEAPGADQGLAK
jgi:hypothetical protein